MLEPIVAVALFGLFALVHLGVSSVREKSRLRQIDDRVELQQRRLDLILDQKDPDDAGLLRKRSGRAIVSADPSSGGSGE